MSVDLEKLAKQIDEALAKETPESLTKWLNERRQNAETGEKQCNLPVVSPRLFYVVAPCQYEEGNLEQITNGLTYERAVAYRDGDFCKDRWPNAYILASLNEG